jgi:hypothetical protein
LAVSGSPAASSRSTKGENIMGIGTIFQLVGAIVGIIWALVTGQYALASLFSLHLTGDGIVGFLLPLQGLLDLEQKARKYIQLRPFLAFVGLMLMNIGKYAHISFKLVWFLPVTSNGLFLLGLALALIGIFTYLEIYT